MNLASILHPPSSILSRLRLFLLDHPLLLREVRTRMRGTRTFIIVGVYDLLLILFMGLIYASHVSRGQWQYSNVELGRSIFGWVSYAQLVLMLLIAPGITSGSIATERERRSLDVMAISLLTPREIVWGKLLSSTSFSLVLLISSVPLIGICFMFGGLGPVELAKTLVLIVASILFYSSMAVFFSAACKRTVVAVVLTFVCVLAITLGLPLLLVMLKEVFDFQWNDLWPVCMLISSPFAMVTVVFPHEFGTLSLREPMWFLHSVLHVGLALVWLTFAARFVAYPKAKE
jgi:ABC-type transport system involved in multi-copper enzyme maturation permease subunit